VLPLPLLLAALCTLGSFSALGHNGLVFHVSSVAHHFNSPDPSILSTTGCVLGSFPYKYHSFSSSLHLLLFF
jgi:hypothetical protein